MFTFNNYKSGYLIPNMDDNIPLPLIPSEYLIEALLPIRHIYFGMSKTQPERLCIKAVQISHLYLSYVKNQTREVCATAIRRNWHALGLIRDDTENSVGQTEELCLLAVSINGFALTYVKKQTHAICLKAVENNGLNLEHVHSQTEEIVKTAVKQHPNAIFYAKIRTPEILRIGMETHKDFLMYIENFAPVDAKLDDTLRKIGEEKLGADRLAKLMQKRIDLWNDPNKVISNCGSSIRYLPEYMQTEALCRLAIENDPKSIKFIHNQTETLTWEALMADPQTIKLIRNPTEGMCIYAISQESSAYICLKQKNRSYGVSRYVLERDIEMFEHMNVENQIQLGEYVMREDAHQFQNMKRGAQTLAHIELAYSFIGDACLSHVKSREHMVYMMRKYGERILEPEVEQVNIEAENGWFEG